MEIVLCESDVINLYRNKAKTVRVQRCKGCSQALAMEVSDHIGFEGEYWIVCNAVRSKGAIEHYFKRCGRWFGNELQCPTCLRVGKLPIDKPLNWDLMKETREGKHAIQSN